MRRYNQITIIGNTRRIGLLNKFKALVIEYLRSQRVDPLGRCYSQGNDILSLEANETPDSLTARGKINNVLSEARDYVTLADIPTTTYISYSPIGMKGEIDLFANIFLFQKVCFKRDYFLDIMDMVERAIGVYDNDRTGALVRTFNPFLWLGRLLDFLTSLPFMFFGKLIGVDHARLEAHFLGRVIKIIERIIVLTFAILGILDYLGYLGGFKDWIIRLFP